MIVNNVKNLLLIVLGNFILAFAVGFFILPFNILSGGVAGVAVALSPLINVPSQTIVVGLIVSLFLLGCIFLGKEFAMKTILSSVLYPVFLSFISANVRVVEMDIYLATLYGGVVAGVGIGLVLSCGASTGGMDIPPLIVHKYTKIPISTLFLISDAFVVGLGLLFLICHAF